MAKKVKKIDPSSIKLFGPVPRTIGTLITVLVVTSSFGVIGWRQLQSSKAQSAITTTSPASSYPIAATNSYAATHSQNITTTSGTSQNSRLLIFSGLAIVMILLLLILRMWI